MMMIGLDSSILVDYNMIHKQKRAKTFDTVNQIKIERGCWNCGYRNNTHNLVFAHYDANTKYRTKDGKPVHISKMVTQGSKGTRYSVQRIYDEMNKCLVLCANCHGEFDYPEANTGLEFYPISHDISSTPSHFKALYEAYKGLYEAFKDRL